MDLTKIPSGKNVPFDINVIIEIPQESSIKYEVDKDSGAIFVDRFLHTPMVYPSSYGFIPQTLADDGDPIDALVLTPIKVAPGAVIRTRPIGMLKMEDESGIDEKIICVPHSKIYPLYTAVNSISDLPDLTRQQIEYFFTHYKDLEKDKWVTIRGWANIDEAAKAIESAVKTYKAGR